MSEYTPGIYRGPSAGCFGLWRLTPEGRWLFSMPVEGDKWRDSTIGQDAADLAGLVLIAADDDTGPVAAHDAEVRAQALEDAAREADRGYLWNETCDDIAARIRALATPEEPTPADLARIQAEYFKTLAKLDPSPEMARIIEQAKRDLAFRENGSSDS